MESGAVVPVNVADTVSAGVGSGGVRGAVHEFLLVRGDEGSGEGIIVAYARAAEGLPDTEFSQHGREHVRGVVASSVGMKYRVRGECQRGGGVPDGRFDERGLVVVTEGVPDEPLWCGSR